jgi:hypothetical protein
MSAKRVTTSARSAQSKGPVRTARAAKGGKAAKSGKSRPPKRPTGAAQAVGDAKLARAAKAAKSVKAAQRPKKSRSRPATNVEQAARPVRATMASEALAQVAGLADGARRIVLAVTVPVTSERATIEALGLDPLEAQPRQAFYFDTPGLDASRAGLVVRARRIKGGRADTVVKLLSVSPSVLETSLAASQALEVEVESTGPAFVCSAGVRGRSHGQEVLDVTAGAAPLRSLLSAEQNAFFDAHAPAGLTLAELVTLGPILLFRSKRRSRELDQRLVVELWHRPDGARVLQISTKCFVEECSRLSAELMSFLASHGLTATSDQASRIEAELELLRAARR